MSQTSIYPSHNSGDHGRSYGFHSFGYTISGNRYQTRQFSAYNHSGLNIAHPSFTQEDIPRGVHGENLHQNHPYYYYTSMPTHPNQRMPPHPNHNMPLHFYSKITPHQVFLCPYCTSNPIYSPYVVPHYPYIPPVGYLHTSYSRLPSHVLPPHSKRNMSESISMRRNRRSNEMKKKIILSISRRDEINRDLGPYLLMYHMNIWDVTKLLLWEVY